MVRLLFFLLCFAVSISVWAQAPMATYAGNEGKDIFYDVARLSNGAFLVCGASDNLDWIPAGVPETVLDALGINNAQGTNRVGYLLYLSADLQHIEHVVHFPQGAVENIRFIKMTNTPFEPTGSIFISGATKDTRDNGGGYFLARLNNNFVNGIPTAAEWAINVWAEGWVNENQPWDVGSDGKIVYLYGQSHAYDWAQAVRLRPDGVRDVVPNWRTHWISNGGEYHGVAADYTGDEPLEYSGIVFKKWGRCDLRSWTEEDFHLSQPDGNGGAKIGRWPLDVFFNSPCDPANATSDGPGYSGYNAAATPVYGPQSVAIDRRDNSIYLGLNVKSVLPDNTPDFEPAVIAMDSSGALRWWSRLYHEITPAGDTTNSTPDQYIDALAIDYASDYLVVDARCHGNNVENYWEGNTIAANPGANGFQNNFTGTNGNIHLSWLGKLRIADGTLMHSTYVAEYAEGTGGLGNPHPDPNLDGWPNPNDGWPDVNTTRLAKNSMKISADGSVCVLGVGRRTITTANAYQKMVKPAYGGKSAWNSFVRVYKPDLSLPLYSSLVVGVWDTLTEAGGGNTELFGLWKTVGGVVAVGHQTADADTGVPLGNPIPVTGAPSWGSSTPANESAILVYYPADNLYNPDDSVATASGLPAPKESHWSFVAFPNPASGALTLRVLDFPGSAAVQICNPYGQRMFTGVIKASSDLSIDVSGWQPDIYFATLSAGEKRVVRKVFVFK